MFSKKDRVPASPKPDKIAAPSRSAPAAKPTVSGPLPDQGKSKGKGKAAYESRRAEKAGMGLEKWMAEKERRVQAEREAIHRAKRKAEPGRQTDAGKPGLLRRLLDRAHRPI